MNENLSAMVQDAQPEENEEDITIPEDVIESVDDETGTHEAIEETPAVAKVGITSLTDWFRRNHERFDNINYVRVSIRGVDPDKYLIVTSPEDDGSVDEEGNPRRKLKVFESADSHPVLDLPGSAMEAFNNGTFMVLYQYADTDIVFKCYGIRAGLIVVACQNVDGALIPYNIQRVKKRDTEIEIPVFDGSDPRVKLAQDLDKEVLQLLYRQSAKEVDNFTTNQDALNWLVGRQAEMIDINHLLQIDNVLLSLIR